MKTLNRLEKLLLLHRLIKQESAPSAAELSSLLRVSPRTVKTYLEELRDVGAVIFFDRIRGSYVYHNDFDIIFRFEITVTAKNDNSAEKLHSL